MYPLFSRMLTILKIFIQEAPEPLGYVHFAQSFRKNLIKIEDVESLFKIWAVYFSGEFLGLLTLIKF